MPGDSQSNRVAIAADATVGNCQNCSVLHQVRSSFCGSKVDYIVVCRLCGLNVNISQGMRHDSYVFILPVIMNSMFVFVSSRLLLQSLDEYVSSFLALKQKITVSEWVLTNDNCHGDTIIVEKLQLAGHYIVGNTFCNVFEISAEPGVGGQVSGVL